MNKQKIKNTLVPSKQDVFFVVLYGSFFAVMLTFIISFDGTNGFGKKNKIQTLIEEKTFKELTNKKQPKALVKTQWDQGEGEKQSVKKPDPDDISQFGFKK